MTIPVISYYLALCGCLASGGFGIYAAGSLLDGIWLWSSVDRDRIGRCRAAFAISKDFRNLALVFIAVLLFVVPKDAVIIDEAVPATIAVLARVYAIEMLVLLAIALLCAIAAISERDLPAEARELYRSIRNTSLVLAAVGFCIAYILGGL